MGALPERKATYGIDSFISLVHKSARFAYSKFIQPLSEDEDSSRREYILNIILLGSIAMLIVLDTFVLEHSIEKGSAYIGVPFLGFSCIPAFFCFLYFLSRRGYLIPASYLLVATYFLSASYAAYHWSITLTPVMLGYALIIVIASILLGTTFGFITASATAMFIVPLWYLDFHGILPFQRTIPSNTDGLVLAALYFVIMIVAWLSNREIERSLARARKSEHELKEERDLLEVKIEERTHELREAQLEKIEQLNRFAELGRLSSGLFHDMLNILSALSLQVEEHRTNTDRPEKSDAEVSITNAFEATRQIETFMQAIRRQVNHRESQERFSLIQGVEQVIQLVSYKSLKQNVHIAFEHADGKPIEYFGDPFKFQQAILNLLLNAVESYEYVSGKEIGDRDVIVGIAEHHGQTMITIRDHGIGMTAATQEKIFQPFFTTKSGTKGMGVGLATVKKIVEEDFSGTITVASKESQGSLFTIIFPLKTIESKTPPHPNHRPGH